ncbi:helix-turn-helix domain-containing protein [Streptomyces sp. NRAIS4]
MLGAPAEVAPALAGRMTGEHWIVVHGRHIPARSTLTPASGDDPAQLATRGSAPGTPYRYVDGPSLSPLIPSGPDTRPSAPAQAADLGWVLGLSAPASVPDLPQADLQAEHAQERAIAAEAPAVVHCPGVLSIDALIAPADAQELARTRFAPLDPASAPGATALPDTLRRWLTLHGSWDRTAVALQIHRNTLRHPLARVAELLDVGLQGPGVRMEVWFALHWLPDERHTHP